MGSGRMTKNLKNVDLIKMIQFCLKIYDLWRHPYLWVGVWVVGWVQWVRSGQINNSLLNLDLIEIIIFSLNLMICRDTPTHGWVHG